MQGITEFNMIHGQRLLVPSDYIIYTIINNDGTAYVKIKDVSETFLVKWPPSKPDTSIEDHQNASQ
jgi:hypothetical protein